MHKKRLKNNIFYEENIHSKLILEIKE